MVLHALRRYRRKRILRTSALPDTLWRDACASLPFLAIYTPDELARLRDLVVLFLDAKSIVGARGHEIRSGSGWGFYPVDAAALKHGVRVEEETDDPDVAYAWQRETETVPYGGWLD